MGSRHCRTGAPSPQSADRDRHRQVAVRLRAHRYIELPRRPAPRQDAPAEAVLRLQSGPSCHRAQQLGGDAAPAVRGSNIEVHDERELVVLAGVETDRPRDTAEQATARLGEQEAQQRWLAARRTSIGRQSEQCAPIALLARQLVHQRDDGARITCSRCPDAQRLTGPPWRCALRDSPLGRP